MTATCSATPTATDRHVTATAAMPPTWEFARPATDRHRPPPVGHWTATPLGWRAGGGGVFTPRRNTQCLTTTVTLKYPTR